MPDVDGARAIGNAQQVRGFGRRRLQGRCRRETRRHVQLQLAMEARARHDELLRRVGTRDHASADAHVGGDEPLHDGQRLP